MNRAMLDTLHAASLAYGEALQDELEQFRSQQSL